MRQGARALRSLADAMILGAEVAEEARKAIEESPHVLEAACEAGTPWCTGRARDLPEGGRACGRCGKLVKGA